MTTRFRSFLLLPVLALPLLTGLARPVTADDTPAPEYKITFDYSADETLAPVVEKMKTLFADDYPKLVKRFGNPDRPAPTDIKAVFVKGLDHPAHAGGNTVTLSVEWYKQRPEDLGALTHELTHLVQGYRSRSNPGWLVEGIADYSRALYGPKDDGWKMPKLTEKNSYTQSYRVTARFLVWLDDKKPGAVDEIHHRMQKGTYKPEAWEEATGKNLDDLWAECVASFKQ